MMTSLPLAGGAGSGQESVPEARGSQLPATVLNGERGTKTTCAYCGVGCGIVATPTGERSAEIKGDTDHPANHGRLCSKGTHLGETIGLEGRLLYPEIAGRRVDWDTALDHVAEHFKATIAEHGPDSVAFYVSGQLLTEDYYVANKLMKGFIGSGNIDTNSRLCMASAVAAHNRAFGEDVVPCSYDDLEHADLIILVGSNTAWCHPVIWQRIEAARAQRGTKLIVIDPRSTETAQCADLHLPISPDGDVELFNALLLHMRNVDGLDQNFLRDRVSVPDGFWENISPFPRTGGVGGGLHGEVELSTPNPSRTREHQIAGLSEELLRQFFDLFAAYPRTITLFSQGANQSTSGTDKGNAIINVHLATGRIGQLGMGPFSITGQPNAMGGREVGGLASTLAAHMGFSQVERDRVKRFWQSPTICGGPGLKAVEMFDAVASGKVKAIWVIATNPAVSMPDAGSVRAALAACPLVVVSDCIADTDTAAYAHVKLPALGWGEKDGTVTNSERCISRQRSFLDAPGEARPDWWALSEIGKRMGWADAFAYVYQAEIFAEFAEMTRFENEGERHLILPSFPQRESGHGGAEGASFSWYDDLTPFQWGGVSPFESHRFTTPNGKANLVLVAPTVREHDPVFPFRLNTGRYRDQWHTMTRTGLSPKLSQHRREPLVEVHSADATAMGLVDGGLARVATPSGASTYRVQVSNGQRRGELFVPMHWTDQQSSGGRTGLLPGKDRDPLSGQPGFKNTAAAISAVMPDWSGFLVTRTLPDEINALYHAKVRTPAGWLIELAGMGEPDAALALLPTGQKAEVVDAQRGTIRAAVLVEGRLEAALFVTRDNRLPPRDWLVAQLSLHDASPIELLAGRPATPAPERGPIVCVCFDVGMTTIIEAIAAQLLTSVEAVGAALNAGTNCGSCRPAIARLLQTEKEVVHG